MEPRSKMYRGEKREVNVLCIQFFKIRVHAPGLLQGSMRARKIVHGKVTELCSEKYTLIRFV